MASKWMKMFTFMALPVLVQQLVAQPDLKQKSEKVTISVDAEVKKILKNSFVAPFELIEEKNGISLIKISEASLPVLSSMIHHKLKRCGGFMLEDNRGAFEKPWHTKHYNGFLKQDELYRIDQQETVKEALALVDERSIHDKIKHLSSYQNRYHKSLYGKQSQEWLKSQWLQLAKNNQDISVEFFNHGRSPQPSVVMTWAGKSKTSEVVVLGGHGDSIAGWFPGNNVDAPGADDNASGIATISEVVRVLLAIGYQPERTIKFMAYAAEEVGLWGSQEIARDYRNRSVPVVGVMQLDMTNYSGSSYDIVLINDHTNAEQNQFLKSLQEEYLPELNLTMSPCGYACSDHASWTREGYPASFPFESLMDDHNPKIHTADDTLDRSQNNADHAVPFAKLALAFLIELATN